MKNRIQPCICNTALKRFMIGFWLVLVRWFYQNHEKLLPYLIIEIRKNVILHLKVITLNQNHESFPTADNDTLQPLNHFCHEHFNPKKPIHFYSGRICSNCGKQKTLQTENQKHPKDLHYQMEIGLSSCIDWPIVVHSKHALQPAYWYNRRTKNQSAHQYTATFLFYQTHLKCSTVPTTKLWKTSKICLKLKRVTWLLSCFFRRAIAIFAS